MSMQRNGKLLDDVRQAMRLNYYSVNQYKRRFFPPRQAILITLKA